MNQPVLLKGNSLGLTMVLDPGMKFDQLIKAIEDKLCRQKISLMDRHRSH